MSSLFSESVVLVRRGAVTGRTATNDPVYGAPVRSDPVPGWVETGFGSETVQLSDKVETFYTLWLDGDWRGLVDAYDGVEYSGVSYRVSGPASYQPGGAFVPGWTCVKLSTVEG